MGLYFVSTKTRQFISRSFLPYVGADDPVRPKGRIKKSDNFVAKTAYSGRTGSSAPTSFQEGGLLSAFW